MGPHPFPTIVRDFQSVISKEIKEQIMEKEGRLPDAVLACVGGGSNAIGAFYHFIPRSGWYGSSALRGCRKRRQTRPETRSHHRLLVRLGIFHGMKSYFCQDEYGQIAPVYSISAGLDYPGHRTGARPPYTISAVQPMCLSPTTRPWTLLSTSQEPEGIIPAIESAHAVAYARKLAPTMGKDQIIVINISGRGDKDCAAIARYRGEDLYE